MATPVLMPRQGQSVESCILTAWKVRVGDVVQAGQPLASIETDKATFEVESPAAGTVLELFWPEGADVPVLTAIAALGDAGEEVAALRPGGAAPVAPHPQPGAITPQGAPPVVASPPPAPASAQVHAPGVSPRARRAAHAAGVDAEALAGSGPGGRVLERDVQAAAAGAPRRSATARAMPGPAPERGSGPGGMVLASDLAAAAAQYADVPLRGVRKLIAERMRQSLSTTAQLTLTMSFAAAALQRYRAAAKERGRRVTINDVLVALAARTLRQHPGLNAHFLGDRIRTFTDVHLGIAVDTPRGLMVPVLRNADRLSLDEIGAAVRRLADACQGGNVNPDLLAGSTFTLTNLGVLGVETFTPVLNAPEVAILGVGGLHLRAVKQDDAVTFVESITLSLTVDHQAVDGAPAARFLADLCRALEQADTLLPAV